MKTITIDGIEYQLTPVPTEAPKLVQWDICSYSRK